MNSPVIERIKSKDTVDTKISVLKLNIVYDLRKSLKSQRKNRIFKLK